MVADELKAALLEFIGALRAEGLRAFLSGGYGLYLQQTTLLGADTRTYLERRVWPRPRATADIDVFLPAATVADADDMARVRAVLDRLGYRPTLAHLHFERPGSLGPIKIELLAGPVDRTDKVKITGFRVRARQFDRLHAYMTREAIDLELQPVELRVDDTTILVPNSFAYLLMKLHAFADRRDDDDRQLGRHHALDVYRIVAMMTEADVEFVRERITAHRASGAVRVAAQIVAEYFATPTSLGVLRLREHPLAGGELDIVRFVDLLAALFGPR